MAGGARSWPPGTVGDRAGGGTVATMTDRHLYRLAGLAGVIGGTLTVLAVARRTGVIPENGFTHALAPPATALLLFTLTAFHLRQRHRAGRLGLTGFVLNHLGLSGLFAIEFATHAIFQYQDAATREQVLTGPGRLYFLVVALTFLAGVLLFGAASWRAGVYPRTAVVLYVAGFGTAALRTAVPEPVYVAGLLVGSAGLLWLSTVLLRSAGDPALHGRESDVGAVLGAVQPDTVDQRVRRVAGGGQVGTGGGHAKHPAPR